MDPLFYCKNHTFFTKINELKFLTSLTDIPPQYHMKSMRNGGVIKGLGLREVSV